MNFALTGNIRRFRRKSLIGQLVVVLLGVELLIFASFTSLELPTPTQTNIEHLINSRARQLIEYLPPKYRQRALNQFPVLLIPVPKVRTSPYVPLCPAAVFIGYTLGAPLGLTAVALYVVLGLLGPYLGLLPFAAGGGLQYFRQPSFGYLLGLIPGAWLSGRITAPSRSSLRQLIGSVGGLAIIHIVGLVYLVGGALTLLVFEGETAYLNWQPWLSESIRNLSWYTLPYDAIFTLMLVGMGFPFVWLNGILTAPDIGAKPKTRTEESEPDRELESALI